MRLMHRNRLWIVFGLLWLCALVYYGSSNDGPETMYRSLLNKGANLVSMVRSRTVGETPPKVVPPVKQNVSFPDHDDGDLMAIDSVADQGPVSVGENLDPDAGPESGTVKSLHQRNVGMFLEIDEEPGDHISLGISPQRNVGAFLSVDAIASEFVVSNESKVVNIGEFIDVDGSE